MPSSSEGSSLPHRRCGPRPRAPEALRTVQIVCRVTAAEKAEIAARAAEAGRTLGGYLRQSALEGVRGARAFAPQDRAALGRIGGNLNQIARAFNAAALGAPADEDRLRGDLAAALAELRELLEAR